MAKSHFISFCVFFLLCLSVSSLGNDCITQRAERQLGVRESGGNNRGWKVGQYLESVNMPEGNSWCAAYVHWVLDQCGYSTTITAWSPTAFNKKNVVYLQNKWYKKPEPGDVFVMYSLKKKRIAHTGFVKKILNDRMYISNEGNAAEDGAVNPYDGDGVYEKIRSFHSTYGVSRWH